jgi:hypothetical protein
MAKVTVSLFGDKELEVPDDEVAVLRSQNILTSVDGEPEEGAPTGIPENVLPAAELKSAGETPAEEAGETPAEEAGEAPAAEEATTDGGEAPADQQPAK